MVGRVSNFSFGKYLISILCFLFFLFFFFFDSIQAFYYGWLLCAMCHLLYFFSFFFSLIKCVSKQTTVFGCSDRSHLSVIIFDFFLSSNSNELLLRMANIMHVHIGIQFNSLFLFFPSLCEVSKRVSAVTLNVSAFIEVSVILMLKVINEEWAYHKLADLTISQIIKIFMQRILNKKIRWDWARTTRMNMKMMSRLSIPIWSS